ncbi:MAG: helix-hairpin-helix domain-containing protein [Lentihominibacter sp.]|uniref:helix-hairpin-helix domain-containing protein n=1 Tax=Lentihominibacter sp. TaxID=2944216 RepID=UPI002A91CD6A|nr:helix-hairpin-helix domain-containing protein [Lentihominibacter sp.]MDY5287015.1 helix-hairpin-helix domain-containing protein [Lentihominibacter sp.]
MKKLMELLGDRREISRFLREHKEVLKKAGIVVLVIVLGLVVSIFKNGGQEEANAQAEEATVSTEETAAMIYVDVGGEVKDPSVVELPDGSRVTDAITAAGGLTEQADLTDINRAAFVSDGEKIYIPSQVSELEDDGLSVGEGGGGGTAKSSDGRININTADSTQLQELTGVGPATAEKIIDYRKQNGRFQSIEDIKNVSGIGDKTYEKLKDHIKV